jgi:hypothetical protein
LSDSIASEIACIELYECRCIETEDRLICCEPYSCSSSVSLDDIPTLECIVRVGCNPWENSSLHHLDSRCEVGELPDSEERCLGSTTGASSRINSLPYLIGRASSSLEIAIRKDATELLCIASSAVTSEESCEDTSECTRANW